MKASCVALGCLLLIQGGCRSQPDGVHSQNAPNPIVQELIQKTQSMLPGWTVTYDDDPPSLQIERNQPVLTYGATIINGSPFHEPVPPRSSKPLMGFRFLPYLTPAAWQAKHADLQRRMIAIEKELTQRQGKEALSLYRYAHTEAEKPLVEEYNRALKEQSALPQYHYQDIGLSLFWADGSFEPFEGVVSETEREECRHAYTRFLGLLRKYEPLAEGQPPDDSP